MRYRLVAYAIRIARAAQPIRADEDRWVQYSGVATCDDYVRRTNAFFPGRRKTA
jgi:hypothetical protein